MRVAMQVRLIRAVGDDVHGRPARLAKHEAPDTPLLVAQGIGDLEAKLHRSGEGRSRTQQLRAQLARGW